MTYGISFISLIVINGHSLFDYGEVGIAMKRGTEKAV